MTVDPTGGDRPNIAEITVQLARARDGALKILENASDLNREATLLHAARAHSRALTLYQISMEECSKIDMLGAWASGIVMGEEVRSIAEVAKLFTNHRRKNFANAYMVPPEQAELRAREEGDADGAIRAFKAMQAEFHSKFNSAKNASLYVDFAEGEFVAPKEQIGEELVEEIATMNARFLSQAQMMMRMLQRWSDNPEVAAKVFAGFEQRLHELEAARTDYAGAVAELMEELRELAKVTGYAEAMVASTNVPR